MVPAPETAAPRRRARRWPLWTAAVLAGVAALWTAFWFHTAATLEDSIERWAAQRESGGWNVRWQSLAMDGFPFDWRARLARPTAIRGSAAPAWFWHGPRQVTLRYRPWAPRTVEIAAPGEHRFGPDPGIPQTAIAVAAEAAGARLAFDPRGRLERLVLTVDSASAARGDAAPAHIGRLHAVFADSGPGDPAVSPHLRPDARLNADLTGLAMPDDTRPVLGRTIGHVALAATLLGRIPAGATAESLALWRDDGGTMEIERLDLRWGPLAATADGTLALDDALQPLVALSARVTGHAETVDAFARGGLMRPRDAFFAKLALGALAKSPEGGGPPEIAVPLTIQDRRLYLGPVALLTLPPIAW